MKRRTFLGVTLGAFSLPVLAQQGRLYGMPQSLAGSAGSAGRALLKLDLSRATVPAPLWDLLSGFGGFWESVLHDEKKARQFARTPRQFLKAEGLEAVLEENDAEVRLLRLMADPNLRHMAASGSYNEFLGALAGHGVILHREPSRLQQEITAILQRDIDGLRNAFSRLVGDIDEDTLLASMSSEPFTRIALAMSDPAEEGAVAAAVVVLVIAAVVVAYVSVGVSVSVGITLGFSMAVMVTTVIGVGGPCDPVCYYPEGEAPLLAGSAGQAANDGRKEMATLLASVSKLDAAGHEEYRNIARAAALLGNDRFPRVALRKLFSDEIDAVFSACRSIGALNVRDETFELVLDAAKSIAYRAAGVADFPDTAGGPPVSSLTSPSATQHKELSSAREDADEH